MRKILIVEDDRALASEQRRLLQDAGYDADVLNTGFSDPERAARTIAESTPDLVLLDIGLAGGSGTLILRKLRKTSDVPVMMVTARDTEADETLCLELGADDYITKPYNPTVLLLHVQAVLRRAGGEAARATWRGAAIDVEKGEICRGEKSALLTKNELLILEELRRRAPGIVSRDALMALLWDSDAFVDDNTLSVNISRLRTKLAQIGLEDAIVTRRGMGYQLR